MKDKLLLIDAYSIICRGFYALPLLSTSNGYHTNAMLGFLNILFRTIDEEKPKYIAVAFDENAPTFRHKLYKEYKGQRKPMPVELKEQVPYVKEVLSAMNISIFSKVGFEADDILGTLANKFSSSKVEAVILSGDKDMLQLATKDIKIRLVKTVKSNSDIYPYYAKDVENEYNMTPKEFIDLKAIMGDTSDNIPGLKGIGKITANDLIVKYKSIDNIYKHLDEIKKPSIVKYFTEGKEDVKLYKTLVTIVTDVDIDANINDLEIRDMFNKAAFASIEKYELKSLYKKFGASKEKSKSKKNDLRIEDFVDIDSSLPFDENSNKVYEDDDPKYSYDLKKRFKLVDKSNTFDRYINKDRIEDLSLMAYLIDPLRKDYESIKKVDPKTCFADLDKKIKELKLRNVYNDIELPLVPVLYNMEKLGIAVNEKYIKKFGEKLSLSINELEGKIHEYAGTTFNINSPKQLGDILFNKLGLDYERKKGEKQSTGVEVLQKLVDKHEIIKPIMDYRTYTKLLNPYAE